jgi:hypothetical protein
MQMYIYIYTMQNKQEGPEATCAPRFLQPEQTVLRSTDAAEARLHLQLSQLQHALKQDLALQHFELHRKIAILNDTCNQSIIYTTWRRR